MTEINYADIAHNFLIRRDFLAQSGIDHRAEGGGGEGQRAGVIIYI